MPHSLTEPPIHVIYRGRFHTDTDAKLADEPGRRACQRAAKRLAFRALTSNRPAAQLLHVWRVATQESPDAGVRQLGCWLIADPAGKVTAHRGQYVGSGGPWELADAIVPGSSHAVSAPILNGFYGDRPEAYREMVARHESSLQVLLRLHDEAVAAGCLYATMEVRAEPPFLALLRSAIDDRGTQLVLHDWLEESDFPHAAELQSKQRNKGKWTEGQLLDLLSKPFDTTRRSFSGRAV